MATRAAALRWSGIRVAAVVVGGLALLGVPARGQQATGWKLVWSDEFDLPDGSAPDPARWGHDVGGGGWGNGEIQYYTDRAENSRIVGGRLLIEARKENYGGLRHTSARLLTKGKWQGRHGRIEARVEVPAGAGLWPAFWMLGADIDQVGWPACGEIDIMEHVGRLPNQVFGTVHGPGYSGGESIGGMHDFGSAAASESHVYAVEREPGMIRWFVDGVPYFTVTPEQLGGDPWVFEHDFFLILNLAIGGNFGGSLDPSLGFPRRMWVDYVRVYERQAEPTSNALQNPGFEDGVLAPWVGYSAGGANAAGAYVQTPADRYHNGGAAGGDPVRVRSGGHVGKVFGDFDGTLNLNGMYQRVAAVEGQVWTAGAWALTHAQDLMAGANSAWIEVSFLDSSDSVITRHRSATLHASDVTPGAWVPLEVDREIDPGTEATLGSSPRLVAPPGTVGVEMKAVFRQPGFDAGAMYFDDFRLNVEPPPSLPAAALTVGWLVSWPAGEPDSGYRLEESADGVAWSASEWLPAGTDASSAFVAGGVRRFRVVESMAAGGERILSADSLPGFRIGWTTAAGFLDQLESSTDLGDFAPWGPAMVGDGNPVGVALPATGPARFYRVSRSPGP